MVKNFILFDLNCKACEKVYGEAHEHLASSFVHRAEHVDRVQKSVSESVQKNVSRNIGTSYIKLQFSKLILSLILSLSLTLCLHSQTILCTDMTDIALSTTVSNEMDFEQWLVVNELLAEAESDRWMSDFYQNDSVHPYQNAQKTRIKNPNQSAYFVSPLFVPTDNTVLRFEYSINLENQSTLANLQSGNIFEVRLLTDCETETTLWEVNEQNEIVVLDLGLWQNDSIRIAFYIENDELENTVPLDIFVDNIFIGETPLTDLGFIYPQDFFDKPCLPLGIPFEIAITNYGTNDVLLNNANYDISGELNAIPFSGFNEIDIPVNDTILLAVEEVLVSDSLFFEIALINGEDLDFNNAFSELFLALPTKTAPFLIDFDENFEPDFLLNFENDFLGFYGNDFNSENSLGINLTNTENQKITTAPIFIQSNTSLIFDISLTDFFSENSAWFDSNESLNILISTDCGYTKEELITYDETTNYFEEDTIPLSNYIDQTIVLEFVGSAEKDLFLDNLHFATIFNNDVSLSALESPNRYYNCFSDNEHLLINMENLGLNAATVEGEVQLAGTILFPDSTFLVFTDNLMGTELDSGESGFYETINGYDFSQYGNYELHLFLEWNLDNNQVNDTLQSIYFVHQAPDYDIAFPLDFEEYNGENLNAFSEWIEIEGSLSGNLTPNYEETNSAWVVDFFANDPTHINENSAAINLWENNKKSWLISPRFEVVDSTQLVFDLALTQFANTMESSLGSDDTLAIMVSTDCGATFEVLELYNANSVISSIGQTDSISLLDFSGQEIVIGFYASEGEIEDEEDVLIFIDNIQVIGLFIPPGDVGVGEIVNPVDEFCETDKLSLVLLNQNYTDRLEDDFITTAILSGAVDTILHDTIVNPLDPLGTRFVIFQLQNVYGDSLYITAFTNLENDTNPLNDTLHFSARINRPPFLNLEIDSIGCDSLVILPIIEGPVAQFDWSTGDTTQNLTVFEEGEYILRASYKTCFVRDTINVSLLPPMITDFSWVLEDSILWLTDLSQNTDTLFWQINEMNFNANTLSEPYVLPDTGLYNISLIAFSENCGGDTLSQIVEYTIEEIEDTISALILLENNNIQIYPNPINDKLQIDFGTPNNSIKRIHLFGPIGRKIKTIESQSSPTTISTHHLPAGLYHLVIEENTKIHQFTILLP